MRDLIRKVLKEHVDGPLLNEGMENILSSRFDKVFDNQVISVNPDNYIAWHRNEVPVKHLGNPSFHKNDWGMLWVEDCELWEELMSYSKPLNMDHETMGNYLISYLNDRYKDKFVDTNPIKKTNTDYCGELANNF